MSSMMRWIHHLPVATKLRVIVVYAAASALVTASVLDLAGEAFALRRDLTEHLMTLATMAGENVAAALTAADRPLARHILGALRADPNIRSVTLYDAAGKLFLDLPLAPDQLAPEVLSIRFFRSPGTVIVIRTNPSGSAIFLSNMYQMLRRVHTRREYVLSQCLNTYFVKMCFL